MLLTAYDAYLSGEIFSSEFKNGQWSEMLKLNSNINTRFNETHASLSPDGNTLYFTSDRQGGFGGMDIYISRRNLQGDWGAAVNAGPLINTPFNEETPFLYPAMERPCFSVPRVTIIWADMIFSCVRLMKMVDGCLLSTLDIP